MAVRSDKTSRLASKQNIAFYDELADNYDSILEQDSSNKIIRQLVAEKFCKTVERGWILDFGGGTGLDMKWLTENGYKIFFCEPSPGMKQQAINYNNNILHSADIVFLNDFSADFKTWSDNFPVPEKVNGILSNFAVINNIYELKLLLKSFASVLYAGGHLIALILDNNFQRKSLKKILDALTSFVFRKPIKFYVRNKADKQIVYIHSLRQIKQASEPYFHFCSLDSFPEPGFALLHLTKK
jgi:SAM-dependent methyltransferase